MKKITFFSPLRVGLGLLGLVGLYFGKKYFNGGVSRLDNDMKGKIIIITGPI